MSETLNKTQERMGAIRSELERLASEGELSPEDGKLFDELGTEWDKLNAQRVDLERADILDRVKAAPDTPDNGMTVTRGDGSPLDSDPIGNPGATDDALRYSNPWDVSEVRSFGRSPSQLRGEIRARALSAVEQMQGATGAIRETLTEFIETRDDGDGSIAKFALLTSSPAYLRAFSKKLAGRESTFEPAEREAFDRAMSLTDGEGGFMIPAQLDPTVMISTEGTMNDIRKIARKVVATGDVWSGITSGAVSWSWDAEAAQVSDDATTFTSPSISVHKAAGFVPISLEAFGDIPNVTSELGRLFAAGKDNLEATAFATGSGSGQPFGVVTALASTELSSATNDAFAIADVYTTYNTLAQRYRAKGSWLAHNTVYGLIRAFDTGGGAGLWAYLGADRPTELIGKPVYEAEAMASAVADGARLLIFGDFDNYVIADRVGTAVEFIPHLFGTANNRPTGQRGLYAYYRVGADVPTGMEGAFEMMSVQ